GPTGLRGAPPDPPAPIDLLKPGRWTTRAPMPTGRQEVAVAVLDGRIFVAGGFGGGGGPPRGGGGPARGGKWGETARAADGGEPGPTSPPPTHHPPAATVEARLFVIGGYT